MKKTYFKPEIKCYEMSNQVILAASDPYGYNDQTSDDDMH